MPVASLFVVCISKTSACPDSFGLLVVSFKTLSSVSDLAGQVLFELVDDIELAGQVRLDIDDDFELAAQGFDNVTVCGRPIFSCRAKR